MKIVWLAINSSHSHSSLALPILHAASARQIPAEWDVVQATVNDSVAALSAEAVEHGPDVLAASVYLFNRRFVLDVIRRVRALLPRCRVILGGPEFLGANAAFMQSEPSVDAVLRGEGEHSFPAWLRCQSDKSEWKHVPGLCWIDAHGVYRDNGMAPAETDLAQLPAPEESRFFDWSKPFVQIETSRGCPGNCRFCSSCGVPLRNLPLDLVVAKLERLREREVREVRVLDRTFNAEPGRCAELLSHFRSECGNMRFHLEMHPGMLSARVKTELSKAEPGQLHLEVGLQTSHSDALQAVGRKSSPDKIWAALSFLCKSPALETHIDLLAGLPGLTLQHLLDDLHRLTELGPDEIQLEVLKVLPGTPLREDAAALGIVNSPTPPYDVMRTAQMSVAEIEEARLLSRVVDAYYNQPELRDAVRVAAACSATFYRDFAAFLREHGVLGVPQSLKNRFQHLHAFADRALPQVAECLEYHWLRAGLSPSQGICRPRQWRARLPADAVLVEGNADALQGGKSRIWHLQQESGEFWFVYGRGAARRADAIYRRE